MTLPTPTPTDQDIRRSDAVWELLGDHLVELVESRRKLQALAEYRDWVDELNTNGIGQSLRTDTVAHKLSEILNGTGL